MDTDSPSRLCRNRLSRGFFGPTRMSVAVGWTLTVVVGALPVAATAQQIFMYPAQGQSKERQERDRYECSAWATEQTGFDPTQPQPSPAAYEPPPPPPEPQGGLFQRGLLRGGFGGAALGAVGGAIGGNAGEGAAIGAATGGLFGMFRRREQQRMEMQQQTAYYQRAAAMRQQENVAAAAGRQAYTRAMKACLQGRGYTVE